MERLLAAVACLPARPEAGCAGCLAGLWLASDYRRVRVHALTHPDLPVAAAANSSLALSSSTI